MCGAKKTIKDKGFSRNEEIKKLIKKTKLEKATFPLS